MLRCSATAVCEHGSAHVVGHSSRTSGSVSHHSEYLVHTGPHERLLSSSQPLYCWAGVVAAMLCTGGVAARKRWRWWSNSGPSLMASHAPRVEMHPRAAHIARIMWEAKLYAHLWMRHGATMWSKKSRLSLEITTFRFREALEERWRCWLSTSDWRGVRWTLS